MTTARESMDGSLSGRTALVTGASSGIGLETARALAAKGAQVVLLVRNRERGEAAMAEIKTTAADARLELVLGDLYVMDEVRKAAAEVRKRFDKLHVLVNNAGLIHIRRELTPDGFERTFALNHLAAFLLTYELRELLAASAPARVVTVSSEGHRFAYIDWDDLPYCAKSYSETRIYGASKLCNIWFAREASRRLAGRGVTSNSLHPGVVATNFGASGSWIYRVGARFIRPFMLSSAGGARTSIHLASTPEVEGVSGEYFHRCKAVQPSKRARSDEEAGRLWELSEKLTGVKWGRE